MELEKLKEIWTSLDERMQKQEGLKTAIIKEMLLNKSDKALSRLINYSYFGVTLTLCITPVIIWMYIYGPIYRVALITPIFIIIFVIIFMIIASGIIGLMKLNKIDFSKPVSCNITAINKYKIFYKRGTFIAYLLVGSMLVLFLIAFFQLPHIEPWRLIGIVFSILVGLVLGYWEYKRMFMRNLNSILKSLEELKELEEPEDL